MKDMQGPGPKSISGKPSKPTMSGQPGMNNATTGGAVAYGNFNVGDQSTMTIGGPASKPGNSKATVGSKGSNKTINKDFKAAYNQLQNQIIQSEILGVGGSQNGGIGMSQNGQSQDIIKHMIGEQSLEDYLRVNQMNKSSINKEKAYDRLYKDHEYLKNKKKELHEIQKAKADEELKECTFAPTMVSERGHGSQQKQVRSKEQFLESQQKFMKDKEEKLKKAKQYVLEKEVGQSKKVKPSEFNEKEWLERFTKKEEKKKTYEDPNTTFKPQISKKTEKLLGGKHRNAFEELCQDSKKRQEKDKQNANQKVVIENMKTQEGSVVLLFKKFEKQFNRAFAQTIGVMQMKIEANPNGQQNIKESAVKYDQDISVWRELENVEELQLLLSKLGFVDESDANDKEVCEVISLMLGGRLSRRNLIVFISQIEKVHQNWMAPHIEGGDLDHIPEDQKESYGVMNEAGDYYVSEADAKRIVKRFEKLRSSRQEFVRSQLFLKAQRLQQPVDTNQYHPVINQKSKNMVINKQKDQEKSVNEDSQSFVIHDRASALIQKGKDYEKKREKLKEDREKQLKDQTFTFKPQLQSKYKSKAAEQRSPEKRAPNQIFDELYVKKDRKTDVRTEDIEYERNKAELTFQPKIQNNTGAQSKYLEVMERQAHERAEKSKELEEVKEREKQKQQLKKLREKNSQPPQSARMSRLYQPTAKLDLAGSSNVPKGKVSLSRPQTQSSSVSRKSIQPLASKSKLTGNQSLIASSETKTQIKTTQQQPLAKAKKSVRIQEEPQSSQLQKQKTTTTTQPKTTKQTTEQQKVQTQKTAQKTSLQKLNNDKKKQISTTNSTEETKVNAKSEPSTTKSVSSPQNSFQLKAISKQVSPDNSVKQQKETSPQTAVNNIE